MCEFWLIFLLFITCRYEELLKQERIIWQEVTAHKRQIDSWTTAKTNDGHTTAGHVIGTDKENREGSSLPPAVTEFQVSEVLHF